MINIISLQGNTIKPQRDTTIYIYIKIAKIKNTDHTSWDMGELELEYTAGGNLKLHNHYG